MEIHSDRCGDSLVVRVSGRLDAVGAPAFEAHCQQAIERGERALILDSGQLEYLSSAGLRSILTVAKSLGAAGGEFALANARGVIREVFEVSGFLGMFRCIESLDVPSAPE